MDFNKRHSLRRQLVDYSRPNSFFITICTKGHGYFFEKYPELALVVKKNLCGLDKYYPNVELKKYVVMPNHIHLILIISHKLEGVTLGKIVATLKSKTVIDWLNFIRIHQINETAKIWQRNYYEHIIRDRKEYILYSKYIENNPKNWINDPYHPSIK